MDLGDLLILAVFAFVLAVIVSDSSAADISIGRVMQGEAIAYVKEFREEKDGCISFIEIDGTHTKVCGNYIVERK